MVDHNDRNESDDDLYDETVPRSIFAATWFRAILVLIVVGVIGAVAFPYIHDAMNAPPKLSAGAPPGTPPLTPPPPVAPPAAVTPPTPAPVMPPPAVSPTPPPTAPPATASATAPTPTPPATEKPPAEKSAERGGDKPVDKADKVADKKDAMMAASTPPVESAKSESKAAPKPAAKSTAKAPAPASATSASRGQWFVQVGAFKDAATAKQVATKLREDKYQVDESLRAGGGSAATVAKATTAEPATTGSADQYDVIISGESPAEVNKRLQSKGLVAEATANGAIVKPSLPLRDAVALSKDLAVDGLKVQVRRAGGAASAPTPRASSPAASASGGDTLHRVSVGGFADRATAVATLKELEGKGYKPFLTRR